MSARIERIQNVYLVARDMQAMQRFYGEVLGLPQRFQDAANWVQFSAGANGFALASPAEAQPATAGAVAVFEVTEFGDVAERVQQAGGACLGTRDMGSHGSVMSLKDCEGNVIQLFRRAQPN